MKKIPLTLSCLGALCAGATLAQTPIAGTLPPITITANPLGANDLIAPVTQYSGPALLLRAKTTLGETLDGTPGISSSYFGPNASRPVIRGLDGDRIRILNNGGISLDASGLSHDHAVALDPMATDRIEVLRGPGALLYGGSAVGGVVNVIDNRIPRDALFDDQGGVAGKVDLGLASGNAERSAGVLLEAGNERYTLHADVFSRGTDDLQAPAGLACTQPGAPALQRRICNSASQSRGGALGGSVFFERGRLGASVSSFSSEYGTVAEDAVTIGMRSERYALDGELRGLTGPFQRLTATLGSSVYRHTEFDGPVAGTLFKSSGQDLRLEARQARWGALDGVIGLQLEQSSFSADGEEAFAPYSNTRQSALFAHEELSTQWGRFSFGARMESVTVESQGNPLVTRFVAGSRNFSPRSYALGGLWPVAAGWQLTGNLARTERAPRDYELYADGPHLATRAYEVGNPALELERSSNLDLGAAWASGAHRFSLNAFVNEFSNYISQEASGLNKGDEKPLPEYLYTQVPARFTGLEASGRARLLEGPQTLDLSLRGDLVRASNTRNAQALPRIAPARLGATLQTSQGPWTAEFGASHSAAQTEVPSGQTASTAYTLWHSALSYRMKAGPASLLWFARLDNMGDALAYSATSMLTQTAPGKAPLPGRSMKVGLQASF
jgi:iron complex outermembrane receptor protein